jgi:uncharacterized RDD family membrane protein YckC
MNTITITTPQNTEIEYELGSLGDRIIGALIDWLIIIAYVIVIMAVFVFGRSGGFSGSYQVVLVLFALPPVFYDLACELFLNGQSMGKKVMGIKVISLSGEQPSFSQYLNRWIFRLVDFTISSNMVGLIMVAATEKKQRLGDLIAGTVLVKTKLQTALTDTWYEPTTAENYKVHYPEVIDLKDNDIQLIKEVISSVRRTGNTMLGLQAQQKIEQVLHIQSRHSDPMMFLQTVLTDYNHLTSQL